MASGQPLTDDARWPWLRSIGDWMSDEIAAGRSSVVTCSALRRVYRDLLRESRPEVVFCHLVAGEDLIGERMVRRTDHYMPASLLPSQLATLEPLEPDEPGVVVSVEGGGGRGHRPGPGGAGLETFGPDQRTVRKEPHLTAR